MIDPNAIDLGDSIWWARTFNPHDEEGTEVLPCKVLAIGKEKITIFRFGSPDYIPFADLFFTEEEAREEAARRNEEAAKRLGGAV